jgi:hypothetical protein
MTPERLVYTDTPAFIPVPKALQHRKVEVILWPLDEEPTVSQETPSTWQSFFSQHSRQIDDATPCAREELYDDRLR